MPNNILSSLKRNNSEIYKSYIFIDSLRLAKLINTVGLKKDSIIGYKGKMTLLTNLQKNLNKDGKLPLCFGFKPKNQFLLGRLTALHTHNSNITGLYKPWRDYIIYPYNYVEIDVKSCHQSIYLALGKELNLNQIELNLYVKNRKALALRYGISEKDLKTAVLTAFYGGNPKTNLIKNYNIKCIDKVQKGILSEVTMVKDKLILFFKESKEPFLKNMLDYFESDIKESANESKIFNKEGKLFARITQHIESLILDIIIKAFPCENVIPVHDGIIIQENSLSKFSN
jgi:hypothetical protein